MPGWLKLCNLKEEEKINVSTYLLIFSNIAFAIRYHSQNRFNKLGRFKIKVFDKVTWISKYLLVSIHVFRSGTGNVNIYVSM